MKIPILLATALFLASCSSSPQITGEFTSKDGTIRIHPDGRLEVIVEPRSSK